MIDINLLVPHFRLSRPLKQVTITQGFGENATDFYRQLGLKGHNGQDYRASTGTPCFAVMDGLILQSGTDATGGVFVTHLTDPVIVEGEQYRLEFIYYHLLAHNVTAGGRVYRGQQVGLCDNTGRFTTGSHLHFGMKILKNHLKDSSNGYGGSQDPEPLFTYMAHTHNPYNLAHHTLIQLGEGKGGFALFSTDNDGNDRFFIDDLAKLQASLLVKGTKTVTAGGEEFTVLLHKPIAIAQVAWDAYAPIHYNLKNEPLT